MPADKRSGVRATRFDLQFRRTSILERSARHALSQSPVLYGRRHFGVVNDHFSIFQVVLKQAKQTTDSQFELLRRTIVLDLRE